MGGRRGVRAREYASLLPLGEEVEVDARRTFEGVERVESVS